MDEEQLISALKDGDALAYKELVNQFGDRVFNTCLGIVQNDMDAEDISQEVFIQVFQSVNQFKGDSKISTWLYRIAVTKSLEFLRGKKRKKRFAFVKSLFDTKSMVAEKSIAHFHHPGVELENKERAATLFKAIDQLPENQKTAFILHKLEDLSYAEIAEVMKITLSSVESLMFRAKQNLKNLLENYYEQNEK